MSPPPRLIRAPRSDALLAPLEGRGIRLGLEPTAAIARHLGDPQLRVPSVLVAGTNGKGSTAAILASILRAAGLRVGLYTSPHLESVVERIRLGDRVIADTRLARLLERVIAAAEVVRPEPPTYFEAMTLAAFLAFAEAPVDVTVIEVGLGGRLDATNLCAPIVSVVTPIGFDHMELLGSTLAAIAREKAGTFRAGRTAVVAPQEPEALESLVEAASRIGAIPLEVARAVEVVEPEFLGLGGFSVRLLLPSARATARLRSGESTDSADSIRVRLALPGEHQLTNLATAVAAARTLAAEGFPGIDREAIVRGSEAARWPGRLEAVVLSSGTTVLFDAAHNPAGVAALVAFLDRLGRPFDLLFGAVADKPIDAMLPPLARRARRVTLSRPDSPRAAEPSALVAHLPEGLPHLVEPDPSRALAAALDAAPPLLVACGSIYLLGSLRRALRELHGVPASI